MAGHGGGGESVSLILLPVVFQTRIFYREDEALLKEGTIRKRFTSFVIAQRRNVFGANSKNLSLAQ